MLVMARSERFLPAMSAMSWVVATRHTKNLRWADDAVYDFFADTMRAMEPLCGPVFSAIVGTRVKELPAGSATLLTDEMANLEAHGLRAMPRASLTPTTASS